MEAKNRAHVGEIHPTGLFWSSSRQNKRERDRESISHKTERDIGKLWKEQSSYPRQRYRNSNLLPHSNRYLKCKGKWNKISELFFLKAARDLPSSLVFIRYRERKIMLGWLPRNKINLAASQTVHQEDQKQKPAGEEEREEKERKHKCIFSIGDLLGTSIK